MEDFLVKETVPDDLLKVAGKLCAIPSLKEFNMAVAITSNRIKDYGEFTQLIMYRESHLFGSLTRILYWWCKNEWQRRNNYIQK